VKYQNFFKIVLNDKSIILTYQQLVHYRELFQIYILSLLLTEDTTKISFDVENYKKVYGVSTIKYWKHLHLTSLYNVILLEKSPHKNPLNATEPKRSTSLKKINKFMKKFDRYYYEYIMDVDKIFLEYYEMESLQMFNYFQRYIQHEKKIEMLSVILHKYGKDVYNSVMKHL